MSKGHIKKLTNITETELKNKGVVSLADRPNVVSAYGQGGLSPTQLKLWFDKLGQLMAQKINAMQDALYEDGEHYININNLGEGIKSLGDLTATFLNGSFANLITAYHSLSDIGDENNLTTLQNVLNKKAEDISVLLKSFTAYKNLIKSNEGSKEIGLPNNYDGVNKTLSNLINDISSGLLSSKITVEVFGFLLSSNTLSQKNTLEELSYNISKVLKGELNSELLNKINNCYTKIESNNRYRLITDSYSKNESISKAEFNSSQLNQDSKIKIITENIGEINEFSNIAPNLSLAIKSLNEDIDSLQLGMVPRIIRGVVLWPTPEILDNNLIVELNAKVKEATSRNTANNTDSIQVWDNVMPDAGKIYTYHYWSSEVIGSELDGWYLASIYMSPAITDIPSYVLNIMDNTWTPTPDINGLYYITIPPSMHGMGSDMSLYIDLRRASDDETYFSCNQFTISPNGIVVCYTDEKFNGKLIVRVGKAYYTTNTTNVVTIEMEQVNGLNDAFNNKLDKNGEIGETTITFEDTIGAASNIVSGGKLSQFASKVKNFFARLGQLAFKNSVSQNEIDGLTETLASKAKNSDLDIHINAINPHNLTKSNVGLSNVDNVKQYSSTNTPPYPVNSVAAKTGIVVLNKNDVGLNNVDNTSDYNKPLSKAILEVLDKIKNGGISVYSSFNATNAEKIQDVDLLVDNTPIFGIHILERKILLKENVNVTISGTTLFFDANYDGKTFEFKITDYGVYRVILKKEGRNFVKQTLLKSEFTPQSSDRTKIINHYLRVFFEDGISMWRAALYSYELSVGQTSGLNEATIDGTIEKIYQIV